MFSRVPHIALAVMAAGLIALLLWSLRPRPALVEQDIITAPFRHVDPPSYSRVGDCR